MTALAPGETKIMQRCLHLAGKGTGSVHPNPMVGCVIMRNGRVVGEGFHAKFGGPHAEIGALQQAGKKAAGGTLYVSLEPCAHYGKTPPCTNAIIQSGISRVVIAAKDPNPLVGGKGIRRLRAAGIHVEIGLLREQAEQLNEKFFTFMKTGLPFVGVKLAQTLDGKIADKTGASQWITSIAARTEAHRIRSEYDAILVGAGTVLKDNPACTVRLVKGKNPVRVVVDGRLSLPIQRAIFTTTDAPTWLMTSAKAVKENIQKVQNLISNGVRVLPLSTSYYIHTNSILQMLAAEGISSVLVEGGAHTLDGFISQLHIDKLYVFIAPKVLGGGMDGLSLTTPRLLRRAIDLKVQKVSTIGTDVLIEAQTIKER
jgi:diaminohydroxyphosphoribosylaminopyrimidine deaminase / 5-amino-6-(5-phosphoribosylamino)uracil reductase